MDIVQGPGVLQYAGSLAFQPLHACFPARPSASQQANWRRAEYRTDRASAVSMLPLLASDYPLAWSRRNPLMDAVWEDAVSRGDVEAVQVQLRAGANNSPCGPVVRAM